MANQAILSIWCKDFPEEKILGRFADFLTTVPVLATKPGFTYLTIRAVDFAETPVLEQDLRSVLHDPAGIIEIAKDHLHSDSAFEMRADWDLWVYEGEPGAWRLQPQALEMSCYGEDFEYGFWRERGHFDVNLGFEHFFTGHAGLLGIRQIAKAPPQSPEEARFLRSMEQPEKLRTYQEKTSENIKKLFEWLRRIERALPIENVRLWSEGEENLEARLEEILAAR